MLPRDVAVPSGLRVEQRPAHLHRERPQIVRVPLRRQQPARLEDHGLGPGRDRNRDDVPAADERVLPRAGVDPRRQPLAQIEEMATDLQLEKTRGVVGRQAQHAPARHPAESQAVLDLHPVESRLVADLAGGARVSAEGTLQKRPRLAHPRGVLGENPAVTLRIPVPVRRRQPQGQLPSVAGMLVDAQGLIDLEAKRDRAGPDRNRHDVPALGELVLLRFATFRQQP